MRHVTLLVLALAWLASGRAFASSFEPGTVPDQVEAVGHLDVDALRKTQVFSLGGQKVIEEAIDDAPEDVQALARAVVASIRGVSFWLDGEDGAIYVETRDGRAMSQILAKGKHPPKLLGAVDGIPTFTGAKKDGDPRFLAIVGNTLVLADSTTTLERSIHVLGGKAASLAGSSKLPISSRSGIFMFVTIGSNALNQIQKSAHAKVLQLAIKSIAIDVGEASGVLTANAHAEMGTADALQKAKSILQGLHALGSLSDNPAAKTLLDAVTITSNGLALDVVAKLSVADLEKLARSSK